MGFLEAIKAGRIYLDTNIWLYTLENYAQYAEAVRALWQALDEGTRMAVTSELTLAEVLVKPMQRDDTEQQTICEQFIKSTDHLLVVPISRSILMEAAQVRADTQLKLPDAIHAATALRTNCTTFLTNDRQFQRVTDIPVVLLSEAILSEE